MATLTESKCKECKTGKLEIVGTAGSMTWWKFIVDPRGWYMNFHHVIETCSTDNSSLPVLHSLHLLPLALPNILSIYFCDEWI